MPLTGGAPHKGKHRRLSTEDLNKLQRVLAAGDKHAILLVFQMRAYEEALNATSRPWAPWNAIPADDKPYMRARVADIIIDTLQSIGLQYPEPSEGDRAAFDAAREELCADDS